MSRISRFLESRIPAAALRPAMMFVLPVTAVAPAALFALLWRFLNAEFLPYIGEGYDSPSDCFIAGLLFYFWVVLSYFNWRNQKHSDGSVLPHMKQVYWNLIAATIAVPGGRILFSILPPWDNALGGLIAFVVAIVLSGRILKSRQGRFVHDRGTVLLSPEEARRQTRQLPGGSEPRIRFSGLDLPGEIANGNILTVGTVGTGKTRLHRELLRSIVPHIHLKSDRRVLVYDVKCDLLAELYAMAPPCEVLVLNPFDQRSVAVDLASDVQTPEQARHFAEAFIPPAKGEDKAFFTNATRNIVAGVIVGLNRVCPKHWTLRDLLRITADPKRLRKILAGSDLIAQYFKPQDTFDNIRNTIANVTVELEAVAALWERTSRKISLRDWVKVGGSILVLGGKENLQPALEPLNRIAFKIIATDFLSEPESPMRSRLYFLCDELKTAGRLDALPLLMNARSKGVRAVLGFQDIEGIIDAYGSREKAFEIANRCATVAFLKLTSTETAEWASRRIGELERYEYLETLTKDGTNVGESLVKRPAFMPSEFLNLPDSVGGFVAGIHVIRGVSGPFTHTSHHKFPSTAPSLDFQPRDESDQVLEPWTAEDERRVGINDKDDDENKDNINDDDQAAGQASAKPRPRGPDLGSLGRMSL